MSQTLTISTRKNLSKSVLGSSDKIRELHNNSYKEFSGNLIFEDIEFIGNHEKIITFSNCRFNDALSFVKCNVSVGLQFIACEFTKGCSFIDVEFKGVLHFQACEISNEAILSTCSIGQLMFDNCTLNDVYISGNIKSESVRNLPIKILDTTLNELKIDNAVISMPLMFWNASMAIFHANCSSFESGISFGSYQGHSFKANNIYIISSDIDQRLDFYKGNIESEILLQKVGINEQMIIWKDFNVGSWIKLLEVKASHAVSINFSDNFERLDLCNCWFETSLTISSSIDEISSKVVTLDFDGIISGNYIVENIPTLSIDMHCINFGNVIFNNVPSKIIHFQNLFNYGKIFFNSLTLNVDYNILLIFDSNIGNTEFQNIDFRKFQEVVIAKSDVSSLVLTNSPFPKIIKTYTTAPNFGFKIEEHQKINDNIYYRETYRQLKVAMSKIDNKYYSLMYKSKEMHYHWKELKWSKDKLLLFVNYLSNNHGISWTRGIAFTLSCSYITFLLLNTVSEHPLFKWKMDFTKLELVEAFNLGIDAFFCFVSTFPKLESSLRDEGNWLVDLVIILGRIFIGIGIYQTISAFRKYAK
jgi:hypothetical protein